VGVPIAAVAVAAGIAQTSTGHAVLRQAGLLQRATPYTSLYFMNARDLPAQLSGRKTPFRVWFAIANESSTSREYAWSVLVTQPRGAHLAGRGSVQVASGSKAVVDRVARISCPGGRVRVTVRVLAAGVDEAIDAWATCVGSGG
jgi:hypothetical protein